MAIEKLKINNETQKQNLDEYTIKNHKNSHETQTDQTTDTKQKSRTHVFKISNTSNTICGENCEFSWVKVSL
jgi:hypothetical protein